MDNLKIAYKVLLRRKFFTFISLFGVAFTLMVLIVAAAFYENSYSPHEPESDSDRFLVLQRARYTSSGDSGNQWTSYAGFKLLDRHVRHLPGIEKITIHSDPDKVIAYRDGRKVEMMLKYTDAAFWEIMDFRFLEGGPFRESDVENGNHLAVINEATRDVYFGREGVTGETILLENREYRVSGVVANVPAYRTYPFSDAWVPHTTASSDAYREGILGNFFGTILAEDRSAFPTIKSALAETLAAVPSPQPEDYDILTSFADTYLEAWARDWMDNGWRNWSADAGVTRSLLQAGALVLLFMLLPAVNLININLSRIMERGSEIGVRKAFGATTGDLTRQFIVENLVLTLLGGLFGLIGAWLVLAFINSSGFLAYAQLEINFLVFLSGLLAAVVFGLFSGAYPAWRMARTHPASALKGGK